MIANDDTQNGRQIGQLSIQEPNFYDYTSPLHGEEELKVDH